MISDTVHDGVYFVQFPHPGDEHVPAGDEMPWNVAAHRRKFLRATGRYRDDSGRSGRGELVLWGEWEPPSRVVRRWPASGRLPRALHDPYWTRPRAGGFRQNTDPWIWGEQMLYSNCKQIVGPQRRHTAMQALTPGSVICFGSTIAGEFCLDTLFVVASAEPWVPADAARLHTSRAFVVCTGDAITASGTDAHTDLTLYRGATVDDPIDGLYSFVPARRADDPDPRFARPALHLPGLINAASRQSTWGSRRTLARDDVAAAWHAIHAQVLDAGLVFAVALDLPPRRRDRGAGPTTTRERC